MGRSREGDARLALLVTVFAALPTAQNLNTYAAVYRRDLTI